MCFHVLISKCIDTPVFANSPDFVVVFLPVNSFVETLAFFLGANSIPCRVTLGDLWSLSPPPPMNIRGSTVHDKLLTVSNNESNHHKIQLNLDINRS